MMGVQLVRLPDELQEEYADIEVRQPEGKRFKDLTGKEFKHFKIVGLIGFLGPFSAWLCECECGNKFVLRSNHIGRPDREPSCGCVSSVTKDNQEEYKSWQNMRRLAHTPDKHGEDSAQISGEWDDFKLFLDDMGNCPDEEHRFIVRIDPDDAYRPGNCVWGKENEFRATSPSSRYRRITIDGVTRIVSDWARIVGITRERMRRRFDQCEQLGADPVEAISTLPGEMMPCTKKSWKESVHRASRPRKKVSA
jgi:hypothetical protein